MLHGHPMMSKFKYAYEGKFITQSEYMSKRRLHDEIEIIDFDSILPQDMTCESIDVERRGGDILSTNGELKDSSRNIINSVDEDEECSYCELALGKCQCLYII